MNKLRAVRVTLWIVIAALVVQVAAAVIGQLAGPKRPLESPYTVYELGGPFAGITQTGTPITDADLKGKPYALFFGFTHCPDVCPTTLMEWSQLMGELGSDASRIKMVFVTVDPERDTSQVLANYLSSFDAPITGITGTPKQIETILRSYKAYSKKVPTSGGDYTMDHTATVYLMDSRGRFSATLDHHEPNDIKLKKLRLVLEKAP